MEIIIKVLLTGAVFAYIGYSIKKDAIKGKLFYSKWIVWLGVACLSFTLIALYALVTGKVRNEAGEYIAAGLIVLCFSGAAIACFLEYKTTSGDYNKEGVSLCTPWSGCKECKWSEICDIKYNDNWYWFVFYCKDGKKMRFSSYLTGIDEFISFADKMLDKGKE